MVEIYKSGDLSMLAVLLDASSFTDLIGRYEQLQRLSKQDADLLKQVQDYKTQVTDRKTQLDTELTQEQVDLQKTDAAKDKVKAQLAKQKKALKGKEAQIAQLKKAEAARQAAAAGRRQESGGRSGAQGGGGEGGGRRRPKEGQEHYHDRLVGRGRGRPSATTATRRRRSSRSRCSTWACPTSGEATPPDGFDCSGLVKFAYAQIGVYLPHSSAMQYNYGVYVPQDQLKPGDLVFFYTPIHHVGMYIGGGKMVNATGDHVQIGPVFKSSYHGARRILN